MTKISSETRKISERVFDRVTLFALEKLMREGKIDRIESLISTGKEANVYHGFLNKKEIAIKIYAIETSDFKNMDRYIRGDVRFPKWKNRRHLVYLWARKEFHNLSKVHEKVNCPKPIGVKKNILVMSFIGEKEIPAFRWKDLPPENPRKGFELVLRFIKKMYEEGFVHGDLSEYNVLNWNEEPYLIDFSQGILITHPLAEKLLRRDIKNIVHYFRKFGVEDEEGRSEEEIVEWVKKN
jgi:RIO kinase 1